MTADRLRLFVIDALPVLAGLYGLMFVSTLDVGYCSHSMFWSLAPSCFGLSLLSGVLAATVVGLGALRVRLALLVLGGLGLVLAALYGFAEASRIGLSDSSFLMALFSVLPISGGVALGAISIHLAEKLIDRNFLLLAGIAFVAPLLVSAYIARPDLILWGSEWVQWSTLLLTAGMFGHFVRRRFRH